MKISMVSEHASPLATLGGVDAGGQNVHVAELSAALADHGHDVTVYTRRDDPDLDERVVTSAGYTVVHVPAGPAAVLPKDELLQYMGHFGDYLREQWSLDRPDMVHAHFWMSGLAAQLAARHHGVPAVQTFHALGTVKSRHQGVADTSPPARLRVERLIALGAARVIATCSDEVFELVRMGLPRHRCAIVPCGVDVNMFAASDPRPPADRLWRLLAIGRMVPRKGFDIPITALAHLPTTELLITGGPAGGEFAHDPEAQRLVATAENLGVGDRVRLLGQVPHSEMPALIASADAVVCTPWYEPFGIAPLEAMACGRPVIAAAVGGMLDTVIDGVTGLLVPPKSPIAVAEAARMLFAEQARRIGIGLAARDRACARYTWDRVATDTLRVYESVVAEAAAHRAQTASQEPKTVTRMVN